MSEKKTERKFRTQKKDIEFSRQITFPKEKEIINKRFEILEKLGEGSFSATFRAYDNVDDKNKTLKVFGKYPEVFDCLPEIRSEIKLLTIISHKNLPRCYELHDTDYVFLELEYIEGQNLDHKISKVLIKQDKYYYAKQLAECIFYLHYKNIEHKDLKPENILITNDKKLYLIDFGTAAVQKNPNFDIEMEGTFEYCPPEARKNEERPYQRDVFAYGIILYQMYYGNYPFKINENGNIDYKMPSHLISSKKKIDKIIKNCIQYFPEDRYRSFQEIIEDLSQSIEEKPALKKAEKKVVKKSSFKNMTEDFKKDLKYLWFYLICLLILLPFFFIFVKDQESQIERMVDIDSPPFSVFVNGEFIGTSPTKTMLKKGDIVTFTGTGDLTNFEMKVGKEKDIRLDINGNRVFLNNKLRGMILTSDENIPKSIRFISIRGNIPPERLQTLRGKNLHVGIAPNAPENVINYLPSNIKSLSLRNNTGELDLSTFERFKQLEKLDLSRATNFDLAQLQNHENLKVLNLQRTNTSDINPLSKLTSLRNLNLDSNQVRDLHSLLDNRYLESLNINGNEQIDSIFPLSFMSNLKKVSNNNPSLQTQDTGLREFLERQNNENLRRQQIIINRTTNLTNLVNFLLCLVLTGILVQLFKLIFRKTPKPKPEPKQETLPEPEPEAIIIKKSPLDPNSFRPVDLAVSEKRFYAPEKANALYYLSEMLLEYPEDKALQGKKGEVIDLMNDKVKDHLLKKEYEPVYFNTSAIDRYFPDKKNSKILKKVKKEITKIEEIKWVFIKEGAFKMGDFNKGTVLLHDVTINDFKMSETVVTNKQFVDFINSEGNQKERGQTWVKVDSQYSRIGSDGGVYYVKEPYGAFPVYEVSWFGAQRFCEWLGGRLPTEAEWEFAARSRGKNILYATGDKIEKDKANFIVDPNDTLWHSVFPVKSFPPNKLGLYEMSGNILEWCYDWYESNYYASSPKNSPIGPRSGEMKVVRGGAWCFQKEHAITFYRTASKPTTRNNYIGFRVVLPG